MSLLHRPQQTPPDSPRCSSRPSMMAPERDPNRAVDALVGAIHNLATDDNYKVIADVFREAQDLRMKNARLSTSSRDMLEEYRKFRNELEAAEIKLHGEKTQLQQSVEQKDFQIHGLENDKARLEAELEADRQRLSEESQKCIELVEKTDDLYKAITNLEVVLDDKNKLLADLKGVKSKLDAELVEAKEGLDSRSKELADLELAKTEVESQLTETKASLDEKSKELTNAEETKTTVVGQLAEVNAKLDDKTQEIDDLSEVKASLENQLAGVSKELEDEARILEGLTQAKAKIEIELSDISTKLAEKSTEAESLDSQLAETNIKLDEKIQQAEALTLQLADANAELKATSSEIAELSEAKAAVDTKLTEVSDQLNTEWESKKVVEEELQVTKDSFQKEADKSNVLSDEVAHLKKTLQDRNEEINHLKGEVTAGKDDFDQAQHTIRQLEHTTHDLEQELKTKKAKLDEIDRYKVKLKNEPEDVCVEILDTIWVSILELAEKHFSADLDDVVLRDPSCWANLRSSEYLKHAVRIPLPQSNSTAAKQMRIAAVLAVLSRALTKHIFRPSYLVENDTELAKALRDLEAVSPAQELHTRSTLLAVLPEREKRNAARRVKAVVREVSYLVQHLLSALQYEAFCTALEASCELACRQWGRIQNATMKIEPYFGPPYDDFDWQVLLLPEKFGLGANGVSGGSTLGLDAGSGTIGGGARLQDSGLGDEASTIAESIRSVIDPADIMLVLWPSMCAVEGGELVSITQGLVMAKEQSAAAFDEEGRRRPWLNPKRARSMSQSRKSTAGGPRFAKPFLAHSRTEGGASGGSSSHGSAVYDDRD
ncbi:Myosin-11 [Cytospora mali]|uniref:Myosin-11 n=1 Tax=Cytospora mali TaxID=578113 RepID=A0A194WA91_CYTMA|nr:Myosin-11 [Valsa mali]